MKSDEKDRSSARVMDFCREQEAERRVSCQALVIWTDLQKGRKMPPLDEVDLGVLEELRGNLFVVNTGNGGGQFVIQACGEVIAEAHGDDPCGLAIIDVFPLPLNENAYDCCSYAVAAQQPMIDTGSLTSEDGKIIYRMIVMPLSNDGSTVDHLLGAFSYREEDRDE